MQNNDYKSVQLPKESYELLKEYCEYHSLKIGKFLGKLVKANCPSPPKKGNILRVENK